MQIFFLTFVERFVKHSAASNMQMI